MQNNYGILTFVSFSAEICLIVIGWFVKPSVPSDIRIFSLSVSEVLSIYCLTVSNGMIFKFVVHIVGSHLALGIRLTHVL